MSVSPLKLPQNPLLPQQGTITKIVPETPEVKTFHLTTAKGKPFIPMPGQLAMLSLLHIGEAMFSVTAQGENHLEFSIKKTGRLTDALHEAVEGQMVGMRGPYGNGFPLEMLQGKELLFIAGGIGLAPLRSLIHYCLEHRGNYGQIQVIYGARTPQDLCFKEELLEKWPAEGLAVNVTVDRGDENWSGHVGFVPSFLEELDPAPAGKVVVLCGPPLMIRFTIQSLDKLNFVHEQVLTTLEKRMKCGIGQCGRCNLGSSYVCLDGPVYTLAQLDRMPLEL